MGTEIKGGQTVLHHLPVELDEAGLPPSHRPAGHDEVVPGADAVEWQRVSSQLAEIGFAAPASAVAPVAGRTDADLPPLEERADSPAPAEAGRNIPAIPSAYHRSEEF